MAELSPAAPAAPHKHSATEEVERVASWVYSPIGRALVPLRRWWRENAIEEIDHKAVIAKVSMECPTTPHYIFMVMMAAGIAILGMLQSSPAVVIGAMLLSPLMSPILGAGFALATGKQKWLRISVRSLLIGTVVAILFSALLVYLSPLKTVTEEIAARTRPNLFDLLIALFSSLAGSYAMIRGREGTIVGVAIATALMPPLAAVGFGLATFNWTVFWGALALYVTNFLTIALTATVMARIYGFRTDLSARQGWFQNMGIILVFIGLAIPLGISLRQIALEANAQRVVGKVIEGQFPDDARVSEPVIDWRTDPLQISATVFTPTFSRNANAEVEGELERRLNKPITVTIEQFRVGTNPGAAEAAELVQARAAQEAAATEREINALVDRLALIAGVDKKQVTVDRQNRRAIVQAEPLPDLSLAGWRTLEHRAAAGVDGWQVVVKPPLLPLPSISLADGELTEAGQSALDLVAWAAVRAGLPVVLSGRGEAFDSVAAALREKGVTLTQTSGGSADRIDVRWKPLPQ